MPRPQKVAFRYVFNPRRDSALIPRVKAIVLKHAYAAFSEISAAQELLRGLPGCPPSTRRKIDTLLTRAWHHALGVYIEIPDPPEYESLEARRKKIRRRHTR